MMASDRPIVTTNDGVLPDGTKYRMAVPAGWNGTLLLYSYGPPRLPEAPAWEVSPPMVQAFLERGYALAGCGTTRFWPLQQNLPNQVAILDLFAREVDQPQRTIAWGQSIGGLMTASLVQCAPERLDGALVLCGTVGGGIATHNQQLDCTFTFKTLLAPDSDLQLANISSPPRNEALAMEILEAAQGSPQGRARIALAAAMANIPGWFDPGQPEPDPDDAAAREYAQYEWLRHIDLHVFLGARSVLEERGGGNMSWNTGVDYRVILRGSANRQQVEVLYRDAGLDLEADLDALARAPRIEADPQAVDYFERYITFTGNLGGVPVVTLHSLGDGLVPVDHMRLYGDVVCAAGQEHLLHQLYIARAGHCFFTTAETLVAFEGLLARIEGGAWPDLAPATLNAAARALGPEHNALPPTMGSVSLDRTGEPAEPAFVAFTPPVFARPYDARHVAARRAAGSRDA